MNIVLSLFVRSLFILKLPQAEKNWRAMFAVAGYLTTIRSGSSVPCYLEAPKRCDVVKNNWWPTLATLSLSLGPKPIMGADCHGLPLSSIFCSMCHVICFHHMIFYHEWQHHLPLPFSHSHLLWIFHYDLLQLFLPYHMTFKLYMPLSDVCPHSSLCLCYLEYFLISDLPSVTRQPY